MNQPRTTPRLVTFLLLEPGFRLFARYHISMFKTRRESIVGVALLVFLAPRALAVRPFITDDARVVGREQAQMEMWLRRDRGAFQHWALASYGPIAPLELTFGGVHGAALGHGSRYSIAGPLMQAKFLLRRPTANSWPGIAVSGGAFAPGGHGEFRPHGWDSFFYTAITESLQENDGILIHGNVGVVNSSRAGKKATWGTGSQIRVRGGFPRCERSILRRPLRRKLWHRVPGRLSAFL